MDRSKAIIILSGLNDGKTLFSLIAKNENKEFYDRDGWWTWAINATNVLGAATRTLGSPGIRDDKYYEFIGKLKALSNEYWNFEPNYTKEMADKFKSGDKAEILIVHGCDDEIANMLKEDYGAFTIYITSKKSNKNFSELYDKVLVWDNDTFTQDVIDTLDILTK
jgi:hypothetical protein